MKNIIDKIKKELKESGDEKTKKSAQRFFKEKVILYGVKTEVARKISKENFKIIKNKSKDEIFNLCEELFSSGYLEESFIASEWSYFLRKKYKEEDFKTFEKWMENYIDNWAICDSFCNHTIGTFIEMFPVFLNNLKLWAKSENKWMRRGSAVSLIIPGKKGKFIKDIFEIANILLLDKEDLVQKGYGWMLKSLSISNQKEVLDFIIKNKKVMPRTALRYALEKMPLELKKIGMEK